MSWKTSQLDRFLDEYRGRIGAVEEWSRQFQQASCDRNVIALYDAVYPALEALIWEKDGDDADIDVYQSLFREQEALIAQQSQDRRNDFILSIPIADRPEHLQSCLQSIYQLCTLFSYGGKRQGVFGKIRVVVAEDSQDPENIQQDIEIARRFTEKGLSVTHLGQAEQYELMQQIEPEWRENLSSILSDQPRERFYRKGQAANRNLSYLKMLKMTGDPDNTLYFLVDSDQLFQQNRLQGSPVSAINYFYYIDRIFRQLPVRLLTGKLVGDPPVSPSVMAQNFIEDLLHFLHRLSKQQPDEDCCFHTLPAQPIGDAAYHDLSRMFGFEPPGDAVEYCCPLAGRHDMTDCLRHLSERLNNFFFGEHLTRKTTFRFDVAFDRLQPARTIYPGNYVANFEGLKYVIPFGDLRLRMSGPTAGRLIQAEIGPQFASANMPMLHQRTQSEKLEDDFRPGVFFEKQRIDLSDEFERQFFGDLMLFSAERLAAGSEDGKNFSTSEIQSTLDQIEQELLQIYTEKRQAVERQNRKLSGYFEDDAYWWNRLPDKHAIVGAFRRFIENIDFNFGEQSVAWQLIEDVEHRRQRKQALCRALQGYSQQRETWDQVVGAFRN